MANEYHDAQGRFCSKGDMKQAISDLVLSGDIDAASALIADLKAIEEKREKAKFVAAESEQEYTLASGDKEWRRDGKLHRVDGPAKEWVNGKREWYQNGKRHRLDGPALEFTDGGSEWWVNGKLHREDGPALEYTDGTREWYQNGLLHREDGPAAVDTEGNHKWWVHGKSLTDAEAREVQRHLNDAKSKEEERARSIRESDTDGALSQWAGGLGAEASRLKAKLALQGGVSEHPALFDTEGNLVPAKLLETKYGYSWALLDSDGEVKGWFNPSNAKSAEKRNANNRSKGYAVGSVLARSAVTMKGSGVGMAGFASVRPVIFRTDNGYSPDVEIVDNGLAGETD